MDTDTHRQTEPYTEIYNESETDIEADSGIYTETEQDKGTDTKAKIRPLSQPLEVTLFEITSG